MYCVYIQVLSIYCPRATIVTSTAPSRTINPWTIESTGQNDQCRLSVLISELKKMRMVQPGRNQTLTNHQLSGLQSRLYLIIDIRVRGRDLVSPGVLLYFCLYKTGLLDRLSGHS